MSEAELTDRLRELGNRPYTHEEVVELIASHQTSEVSEGVVDEYNVMPSILSHLLVESWRLADEAGKPWHFTSMQPDGPVQFARDRKVRFVVDVDSAGVTFGIAHVHGFKDAWYQPAQFADAVEA